MNVRDRYTGGAWLLIAGMVAFGAYRLGPGTLGQPGPGFAPLLYASVLALLSAVLVVRSLVLREAAVRVTVPWSRVLPVLVVLLLYGLWMRTLGYLVSTFVAMALFALMAGRRWPAALAFSGLVTLAVHLLFVRLLSTPLPHGTLFR